MSDKLREACERAARGLLDRDVGNDKPSLNDTLADLIESIIRPVVEDMVDVALDDLAIEHGEEIDMLSD